MWLFKNGIKATYGLTVLLFLGLISCKSKNNAGTIIVIQTNIGDLEAELYPDKAPKTVKAFLQFIDSGVYNQQASFYRVILESGPSLESNTGLIQGGTWPSKNERYSFIKGIEHEGTGTTGLSHQTGTLSLARTEAGTAGTEFFICIGDQTHFNQGGKNPADGLGMAAFGKIISGMPLVRKMQVQPATGDLFIEKISILSIKRKT